MPLPPVPSDAEFGILTVVWRCGPSTVREVHEALAKNTGYTSTLKQMQVMHEKGLLRRSERYRSHVYEAAITKEEAQARFAGELMNRVFEGSARSLVLGALNAQRASAEDLNEIGQMLDRFEKEEKAAMTEALLSQFWIQKLGWTLLHFLWQGTVIAVIYAMLRGILGRSLSAQGRYLLACLALAAMALAPPITFLLIPHAGGTLPAVPFHVSVSAWQRLLPSCVAVWLAGVVVFSLRLFGGWRFIAHLRSASHPAPAEWQLTLERIAARVKTSRPVRLLVSPLVEVPTVIGWLQPVILVPLGSLTGLPMEHISALLAHELAHIRRHDYLASILQSIAEAALFYHPAVWWVSEQIRAERELCCDDLAVAVSGDVLTYARALAGLESIQPPRATPALAANGGSLINRVRRLLYPGQPAAENLPGAGAAWAMTILLLTGVGVATVHATPTPATSAVVGNFDAISRVPRPSPSTEPTRPTSHTRDILLYDPLLESGLVESGVGEAGDRVTDGSSLPAVAASTISAAPNSISSAPRVVFHAPSAMSHAPSQVTAPVPELVAVSRFDIAGMHNSPILLARADLPPANPPAIQTLHAEARVVQIEVSVRDSYGRQVVDLSKQDFTVADEGRPRPIDIFSANRNIFSADREPSPAASASQDVTRRTQRFPSAIFSNRGSAPAIHSTVIVADRVNGGWDGSPWARQDVLDLVKNGRPDERIALYVIGRQEGLILVQDYTTDRELLLKSMREYFPEHPWAPANFRQPPAAGNYRVQFAQPAAFAMQAQTNRATEEDSVEDARRSMEALAEHLALVPGRKSVFWVSAGFRPELTQGAKWKESPAWRKTITALNEADIAINAVDVIDSSAVTPDGNHLVMKQIADETGGRKWSTGSNEALTQGIEDSRATYTLGFYLPEGDFDEQFHSLQVRVNRPGLQLFYRQGYYAGATDMPDPATDKKRNAETLETVLLNQIDSHAIGITARVEVAPGQPRGTINLRMNLDPGTLSLKAQREGWTGRVDEMFVELNEQGRTLAKVTDTKVFELSSLNRRGYDSEGVTWPLSGPLLQGATKLTIVVRDTNSGRVGSLTVPLH